MASTHDQRTLGGLATVAGILFAFVIGGCAVGPNYHRPAVSHPTAFRGETATATNSLADLAWWDVFKDPDLQNLIRASLTNNYDVRIAFTRVEQAQALAQQARGQFFPQFNYTGNASRAKNAASGNPAFNSGATANNFDLAGTASWELDLWGRVRRLNESARAQYFASKEAQRDVRISVISQVAQAYFQLRALDRDLEIARDTTNTFAQSLRIFTDRLQGGVGNKLETSAAEAALASVAGTVPDLERQIVIQENLINVLAGRDPGPVTRSHVPLPELLPPEVPAGIPSTLLERRPDIREAEQNLRAINAFVGVAVANFFPQISLTALFGQVSPELSTFTSGTANAWSIAANMTGPLFQAGRLTGAYRQAKAVLEQYRLQYQSSVLNALQEVSNALVSRQRFAEMRAEEAKAVAAYQTAVDLATQRYTVGQSSYYEVLQEQQLLFPTQNALTQTELNQLLAVVQLYRALGGGWQSEKSETRGH